MSPIHIDPKHLDMEDTEDPSVRNESREINKMMREFVSSLAATGSKFERCIPDTENQVSSAGSLALQNMESDLALLDGFLDPLMCSLSLNRGLLGSTRH